ncbi:HEPN domain-containing protein [bacterium]|nr:HEPN domain-containing protein [bacterium]MBU3956539.1 HEPN domain-containing protein [bacterium]
MTAKIKHTGVDRNRYKIYLKKALEFYQSMIQAEDSKNWNAVGLNSVHCAISACDAVVVFHLGMRSVSSQHRDAVELLDSILIKGADQKSGLLNRILAKKNIVEYEDRDFLEKEAKELIKLTTRFFEWVKEIIPEGR